MITYKNFSTYNGSCFTEADMPLDNQGLVLIQGVNKDEGGSNGSGKSTLFDLLAYTITGRTGKKSGEKSYTKKNDLLNLKNPRNFHTQLVFEKGGIEYVVNNYRAHKDWGTRIELWEDGEDVTPTTTLDDVQAKVLDIIGLTADEFYGQTYLSQQYSHALVHGTPSQKKKFLSTYFGLEQIDLAAKVATKFVNAVVIPNEAELEELRTSLQEQLNELLPENIIQDNKDAADRLRGELQKRILDLKFQVDQQKKAKLVSEQSQEWELKVAALGVAFTSQAMQAAITAHTATANSLQKEVTRLNEVTSITSQMTQLGVDTTQSYQNIRSQIEQHEKLIQFNTETAAKLKVRLEKLQAMGNLPQSEKSLKDLSMALMQTQLEAKTYTANLNTLASEISKLSFTGTKCPTCLRPISEEEHREMLTTRQHSHVQLQDAVNEIQQQVRDLQTLSSAKEQAMLLEHELSLLPEGDYQAVSTELQNLKTTKATLQKLADNLVKVTSLQDRLAQLENEKDPTITVPAHLLQETIKEYNTKTSSLKQARDWLLQNGQTKFDVHALSLAQNELNIIEKQFTEANEAAVEQTKLLTMRQTTIKQIADIDRILAKNSEEKRRKRILEVINVTINSIKKSKLSEATGMLTGVLPHYISRLFPGGTMRIATPEDGKEFDLYLDGDGQITPLFVTSGGEAKRVALSIFFAFSQMGTKASNIMLMDEIFKDLDPVGRAACFEIIRELKVPSIFVTTHDQDLQSTKKYDQVWSVVKENKLSKLYR